MRVAPRSSSGPRQLSSRVLRGSGPFGEDGVDERDAREREIFAEFLVGTPVEGDGRELDRLMRVDGTLARMQVVSVVLAGVL